MGFWLSGLDEAGYGPLLGPLVVGLVTVRSPDLLSAGEPWRRLAPVVHHHARSRSRRLRRGLPVADSKQLHRPATGDLSPLERSVLAFVACERGGTPPQSFRELIEHFTEGQVAYLDAYPWYRGHDFTLPVSTPPLDLQGAIRRLSRRLAGAKLEVSEIRALPIDVTEFNENLDRRDSKGDVNAWVMGRFLSWLWRRSDREHAEVWVDRLGGRQRYGSFLYPLFRGARFQIIEQGITQQTYQVEDTRMKRMLTIHFRKEGEAKSFSTALASMTAKYVRELHMRLFNRWWQMQDPKVRGTAGYYQDARRFLSETHALRHRLGIADDLLIRRR